MNADRNRPAPRRRVAPLIGASIGLHLAAVAGVLARPGLWPWALSAVLGDHLMLAAAGLVPRSRLPGSNWTHLPATAADAGGVAITIDDGPDLAVTPACWRCSRRTAPAPRSSAWASGSSGTPRWPGTSYAAATPSRTTASGIAAFSLLGPAGMAAEISRAQDCITQITGESPRFFRAPAGLRNPFLEPVLRRMPLQLASWTRRGFDTVNGDADTVYRRLTSPSRAATS